ncbi:MAG: NADH-quinone oxidoreductase subunit NuoF [Chitinophagaceae bacterium]|jgi:NADH-quinone oxidoreductase subunit F|nr:NADH-quinone oxidoreductase subunit NuoF [Chitinophagaceae bacterium]OQY96674.1 MAG: NADH-quinone oxidoreductase subunit F [Sphingobacteriales bacterium UTBCD1]
MERPLTQHIKKDGSVLTLEEYEKVGGYSALKKALKSTPDEIMEMVKNSSLRGRGGAGFPTGMKWSFVPRGANTVTPKYLVANGDEMEPGTFKDRLLVEGNPHQLIEGMIISSYAIQATIGYVFLRWAYHVAAERVEHALREAYNAGYLGKNILGSGYDLEMHLHTSVGRYMCGEETALLNALEGKRANPRNKPPFPQVSGLFGKPTIVNNVETLCNIPHIIANGVDWYKQISKSPGGGGTKLYGASGRVKTPGIWELPLGTSLREILEVHAGGMQDGYKFRGALPGGASTDFLTEDHLDVAMDFEEVPKAGSRLGTGTVIVMDDKTCPVGMCLALEKFFAQESCGFCTPCREGLPWTAKILLALEEGEGKMEDIDHLTYQTHYMAPGNTFCALAPGAMEPLQSALKYYREDFEKHIKEHRCTYR